MDGFFYTKKNGKFYNLYIPGMVTMPDKKKIKVLIADDHELIRRGFMDLLKQYEEFEFVGEASDGEELIELYFDKKPDVILSDINMPKLDGITALKFIKRRDSKVRALFLSVNDNKMEIYNVYKAGGLGLINKGRTSAEIVDALNTVIKHEYYFADRMSEEELFKLIRRFKEFESPSSGGDDENKESMLTPREAEIIEYIASGFTSRRIASLLNISEKTVEYHRKNLRTKLDLHKRDDFINFVLENPTSNKD